MSDGPDSLVLTPAEITCLAGVLGAGTLLGVPDPFRGWLHDQVQEAWRGIRADLAARGLLTLHPDGSVAFARETLQLLKSVTHPDSSVMLSDTRGEASETVCFHKRDSRLVVQRLQSGLCQLTPLASADSAWQEILSTLSAAGSPDAPCDQSCHCLEPVLRTALATVRESGPADAALDLEAAGVPVQVADALAETLASLSVHGTLIRVSRETPDWSVDGFGFLIGGNGAWLLRRGAAAGEEQPVELVPCAGATLAEAARQLLTGHLPAEVMSSCTHQI